MGIHWKSERGPINFRARFEYLEATVKHWPELLGSLTPIDISPQVGNRWPDTFAELTQLAEFDEVQQPILDWAKQHGLKDAWMLDAAVQTVAKGTSRERWHYIAAELPIQEFAVTFGTWFPMPIPALRSRALPWAEFRKTATATFNRRLKEYHQAVEKTWGVDRPSLEQHAAWTVMWQRGKSAEQIRRYLARGSKPTVTETNIYMAVQGFGKDIGLTLREPKSGPARKT
jgi:hypothetical protein